MKTILSNRRWRWPVLAVIAVLLLGGLTLGGIAAFGSRSQPEASCPAIIPSNAPDGGQVAISEADNGKTIDLNSGEQLALDLKYVPSSGNSWSVQEISDPAALSEVKTVYNLNDV